jgi:hypothetical protein
LTDATWLGNLGFVIHGVEVKTPARTRTSVASQRQSCAPKNGLPDTFGHLCSSALLEIPVVHGMKRLGTEPAHVTNCSTDTYNRGDPDEFRSSPNDPETPRDWGLWEG